LLSFVVRCHEPVHPTIASIAIRGSHVIMERDSGGCVVPMHKEVKVGTLAGLLRQAEITPEEFIEALRG
jgi:hypothetical protein